MTQQRAVLFPCDGKLTLTDAYFRLGIKRVYYSSGSNEGGWCVEKVSDMVHEGGYVTYAQKLMREGIL